MVINPLMTVVLGILVTDDPFGARIAVGSAVALFGVLLITISPEQVRRAIQRVRK
jgi:drug/metabolite transporter (DMT)-like permease